MTKKSKQDQNQLTTTKPYNWRKPKHNITKTTDRGGELPLNFVRITEKEENSIILK